MAVVIALLFVSIWPAWTGNFNNAYGPVAQPADYSEAYEWLAAHANGTRSLWLPAPGPYVPYNWSTRFGYDTVPDPVRWQSSSPTLNPPLGGIDAFDATNFDLQIQQMLYLQSTATIGIALSTADVGYLVIRTDVIPYSFGSALLNGSNLQVDLKQVWSSGPLHIFQNLEPTALARIADHIVVTAGGFTSESSLPWFGIGESAAVTYAEDLEPATVSEISRLSNSQVLIPNTKLLEFVASDLPNSEAVTFSQTSGDWISNSYADIQTGDEVPGGALTTDLPGTISGSFESQSPGATCIILDLLFGSSYYNLSVDGAPLALNFDTVPARGYDWSMSCLELSAGWHVLDVSTTAPGQWGVAAARVSSEAEVNATMADVSQLFAQSRLSYSISPLGLLPGNSVRWSNEVANRSASPFGWSLLFPTGGVGVATTGTPVPLSASNLTLGILGRSLSGTATSMTVYLLDASSVNQSPVVCHVEVQSLAISWNLAECGTRSTGFFNLQFAGNNVSFLAASVSLDGDALQANPSGTDIGSSLVQPTDVPENSPGDYEALLPGGGSEILVLSYGFSAQWVMGSGSTPGIGIIEAGAFGIAAVLFGSSDGGAITVQLDFEPQIAENYGIVASGVVAILIVGSLVVTYWIRRRANPSFHSVPRS